MADKIEVDLSEWHRMRNSIIEMQGHTFFCQDRDGFLRRWHPPEPPAPDLDDHLTIGVDLSDEPQRPEML